MSFLQLGRFFLGTFLVVMALTGAGCQSGPRPAAEFVQQAAFLHDAGLKPAVIVEKDVVDYVDLVGKRIIAGATAANANYTKDPTLATMKFHVVASPVVNACGTGGGHIYLYNGLVQLCETEEELAALMAVQYAHALDLDVQKTGMRPEINGGTDPLAVSRVVFLFMNSPLSSQQLLAADRLAFELYARAGWDPAKFADAYDRLRARGLELPPTTSADGQPKPLLSARSREATSARQSLLPQARDWRQATVADTETFREIKVQLQKSAQRTFQPADRTYLYLAAFPNNVLPADQSIQQQAQTQLRKDLTPPAPPTVKLEAS